jgi:hypothetical protein
LNCNALTSCKSKMKECSSVGIREVDIGFVLQQRVGQLLLQRGQGQVQRQKAVVIGLIDLRRQLQIIRVFVQHIFHLLNNY